MVSFPVVLLHAQVVVDGAGFQFCVAIAFGVSVGIRRE
jgi:hypothetical protein